MVSERVPSYELRRPVDLLSMLPGQVLELENPDLFKWFTQQVGDPIRWNWLIGWVLATSLGR
jgi:hypothetical protein